MVGFVAECEQNPFCNATIESTRQLSYFSDVQSGIREGDVAGDSLKFSAPDEMRQTLG